MEINLRGGGLAGAQPEKDAMSRDEEETTPNLSMLIKLLLRRSEAETNSSSCNAKSGDIPTTPMTPQ